MPMASFGGKFREKSIASYRVFSYIEGTWYFYHLILARRAEAPSAPMYEVRITNYDLKNSRATRGEAERRGWKEPGEKHPLTSPRVVSHASLEDGRSPEKSILSPVQTGGVEEEIAEGEDKDAEGVVVSSGSIAGDEDLFEGIADGKQGALLLFAFFAGGNRKSGLDVEARIAEVCDKIDLNFLSLT